MPVPARADRGRSVHHRTAVDAKLMEKTGLDELTLRRVRKTFMLRWQKLPYTEKRILGEGGTCPRFEIMNQVLRQIFSREQWWSWLHYLEHSERDLAEMARGEYPISPYLIRVYSALFGIKIGYLLLGDAPMADPVGANIDVMPRVSGN